jgi:hypothetical protein
MPRLRMPARNKPSEFARSRSVRVASPSVTRPRVATNTPNPDSAARIAISYAGIARRSAHLEIGGRHGDHAAVRSLSATS